MKVCLTFLDESECALFLGFFLHLALVLLDLLLYFVLVGESLALGLF